MAKVYEFLANGFEEIEALAPVDILRRGGVDIQTVSITGSEFVESSHGVTVKADMQFTTPDDYADADMLLLPGGLPGATNLNDHEGVRQTLLNQHQRGRRIGAICAAPIVLGSLGLLQGVGPPARQASREYLTGATLTAQLFEEDGTIITGEGPAPRCPMPTHLSYFIGEAPVADLQVKMQYAIPWGTNNQTHEASIRKTERLGLCNHRCRRQRPAHGH
jgi:4-methyl-5(b-hydroxyethyl)-thiazole monophosphate biosynthesis